MANTSVVIHIHGQADIRVTWYPSKHPGQAYGVIDMDDVRLFMESEHLDALARAVEALQRERDGETEQEAGTNK